MRKLSVFLAAALLFCAAGKVTAQAVANGTTGSCTWTITGASPNYTLTVSGAGAMTDYSSAADVPWHSYRTGIKSLSIAGGVTRIGNYAFSGCTALPSVAIPASVIDIGNSAFEECTGLSGALTVPDNVRTVGERAFFKCEHLTSATLPDGVTEIRKETFRQCSTLMSVTFSDALTAIGNSAFAFCEKLASAKYRNAPAALEFPNTLVAIGAGAFSGCKELAGTLTIPDAITTIEQTAFSNCQAITTVIIGNGTIDIGYGAFISCTALQNLTIGSSVTNIESLAFSHNNALSNITVKATTPPSIVYAVYPADETYNTFFPVITAPAISVKIPCTATSAYASSNWATMFSDITGVPFTLTVKSNDYASGSVSKTQNSDCTGNTASIEAIPAAGSRFVEWDDNDPTNPRTVTLTADMTLTAVFERVRTLAVKTNDGTRGSVTMSATGSIYTNGVDTTIYSDGASVTITANANPDHQFLKWEDGSTDVSRTFTITADATYKAIFDVLHTVTVNSGGNGTVTGGGSYKKDSTYTVTATPAAHYRFKEWNDGTNTYTNNPLSITLTDATPTTFTYTATFEQIMHSLTAVSGDATKGTVASTPSAPASVADGTSVTVTATAAPNFCFVRWNDGNTDNPRTFSITSDMALTAEFDLIKRRLTLTVENPTMGTVTGSGDFPEYSMVNFSATPNTGYRFVEWTDGVTANPRAISLARDTTFTARFTQRACNITVTTNDPVMGSVTGGGTYTAHLEDAIIVAFPQPGYRFRYWNDRNATNPRTIDVLTDSLFRAEFEAIPYHSVVIRVNNGYMGDVANSGGNRVADNTVITIRAIPDPGYRFVQWNDGNIHATREITVMQPVDLTAIFELIPEHRVTLTANDRTMGTVVGAGDFSTGQTAIIGVIPNTGYRFVRWSDGNTQNPRTITVTGNISLTAIFEASTGSTSGTGAQHRISVYLSDPDVGIVIGAGAYEYNTTATVGIVPHIGYQFVKWSDGNTQNPRKILVKEDVVLIPLFTFTTGIEEVEGESSIKVSSNPETGDITVILPENESNADLLLYDLQGRLALRRQVENYATVSTGNLPSGIYIYNIVTSKQTGRGKLLIAR
ncbi:MAG: leucine-rich repeat protein [Tannerella sp.]|nr:leucine-rich repeat protein [Tannerella sp.]